MGIDQKVMDAVRNNMNIAATPKAAIEMARTQGFKISAAQEKAILSSLNGGANWGVFDGFEKSETQQFCDDLAKAAKYDPVHAAGIAARKGIARDVAKNPTKYTPKRFDMSSGRYVVYQKDQTTGKDSYTYYDKTGKKMSAEAFKQAEGLRSLAYDSKSGKLKTGKPKADDGKAWSDYSTGEKVLAVLGTVATLGLASCSRGDDITEYNFTNENKNVINITFDNASLVAAMQEATDILNKIQNNTYSTNQELQDLKKRLDEINKNIVNIITNQQQFAKSADDYFKQILNVTNGNQKLLQYIVDQLAEGNDTLKQIKALMEANNASLQDILEAITKCKYGIDVLHEDNNDIKKLVNTIATLITKLPSEMQAKFGDYFNQIIKGIADNGVKLDALYNLLSVVNKNVQAGNTAILKKMDQMQQILDKLFAKFNNFDAKVTNMLNAIATAIADMAAKNVDLSKIESTLNAILDKIGNDKAQMEEITKLLQSINANTEINGKTQMEILEVVKNLAAKNVDLGEIQKTLNAILDKIGNDKAQMEEITKLLQAINANTVINGQTQLEILKAIKNLDGNMSAQFTKLLEIANKNKELQGKTNELINEVLKAIDNLNIQPGSPVQIDLTELLDKIDANGADLSSKLSDIYAVLDTINGNIIKGNNDNMTFLTKILGAIQNHIGSPDFSEILAKLDEILAAIKNHEVDLNITVDGHFTICDKDGNVVHEGEMDNLDWVLG